MQRRILLTVASALLTGLGAPTARAQPAEAEPGAPSEVTFEIVVMAASSDGTTVDPGLEKLSKRLDRTMFTSFRKLAEKTVSVGLATQETVVLPGGRNLVLKPRKFGKTGRLNLFLRLEGKSGAKLVELDASIEPGGDLMLAGPKMDDGTLMVYLRHAGQKT